MIVWVLSHEWGHGYAVDGVFASEELARGGQARLESEWPEEDWVHWSIEQHKLRPPWDCKPLNNACPRCGTSMLGEPTSIITADNDGRPFYFRCSECSWRGWLCETADGKPAWMPAKAVPWVSMPGQSEGTP